MREVTIPVCGLELTKTATPDNIVLMPPPSCDNLTSNLVSVTFKYTGGDCSATTNTQSGKAQ